ncbi:MAG: hypothetical protein U9N07_08405 [Euryarchaeota archaeon]|nr:hypothetical protein [Euryarchaeota archaeon]
MAKGLDIGTMNLICAESEDGDIVFKRERNAFLELESSDLTKTMLDSAKVLFIVKGGRTFILGESAFNFATIFGKGARRPMRQGIISPDEKDAIPMIKLMVDRILGEPSYPNEILCTSVPADPIDTDMNTLYHRKMAEALSNRMNFKTILIDEGLAAIHSELADHSFTGLGISLGAGLTNVTLAYMATPVMSFSIGRGGDWIDEQSANTTGLSRENVCDIKERGIVLGKSVEFGDPVGAITIYYDALITYIIKNLDRKLAEITPPNVEFPVILAGGSSLPNGFLKMFERQLKDAELSIDISSVKLAKDPLYSVARGCLIAARAQEVAEGVAGTEVISQIEKEAANRMEKS